MNHRVRTLDKHLILEQEEEEKNCDIYSISRTFSKNNVLAKKRHKVVGHVKATGNIVNKICLIIDTAPQALLKKIFISKRRKKGADSPLIIKFFNILIREWETEKERIKVKKENKPVGKGQLIWE